MAIEKMKNNSYKVSIISNGVRKHLGYFSSYDRGLSVYIEAKAKSTRHRRIDTKFNDEECVAIRESPLSVKELSEKYNVHFSTIYRAIKRVNN